VGLLLRLQGCHKSTVTKSDSIFHLGEPSSSETTIKAASLLPAAASRSWRARLAVAASAGGGGCFRSWWPPRQLERPPLLCALESLYR
jgi:hypothetical protein